MKKINGPRCPSCNGSSLYVGESGYVICSRLDCPNPDFTDALQRRRFQYQKGQITQLKIEKRHLKESYNRRVREINDHIKNLEKWISEHETLPQDAQMEDKS